MESNVAGRLNPTGGVSATYQYDAYGLKAVSWGTSNASDPWTHKASAGYYTDTATGLYLCDHRFYNPYLGTWITRDPIGQSGGTNLYAYCGGNPLGLDGEPDSDDDPNNNDGDEPWTDQRPDGKRMHDYRYRHRSGSPNWSQPFLRNGRRGNIRIRGARSNVVARPKAPAAVPRTVFGNAALMYNYNLKLEVTMNRVLAPLLQRFELTHIETVCYPLGAQIYSVNNRHSGLLLSLQQGFDPWFGSSLIYLTSEGEWRAIFLGDTVKAIGRGEYYETLCQPTFTEEELEERGRLMMYLLETHFEAFLRGEHEPLASTAPSRNAGYPREPWRP